MKIFKFEVIIREQSDEFWDDLRENNKIGAEELVTTISEALESWDFEVRLKEYTDK